MYEMVKIAGLSAALAGALMVAVGQHEDKSTAGKILTERLDVAPVSAVRIPNANDASAEPVCAGAWPYRDCADASATRAKVRIITSDARAIVNPVR